MHTLNVAFLLLMGFFLAGCGEQKEDSEAISVAVENLKFNQIPGGARIITGELYNAGPRHVRNAVIHVSLFNAENTFLSTMNIMVLDVAPGVRKPFREPVDSKLDVHRVRLRDTFAQYE